jgi:hypothetical protein
MFNEVFLNYNHIRYIVFVIYFILLLFSFEVIKDTFYDLFFIDAIIICGKISVLWLS